MRSSGVGALVSPALLFAVHAAATWAMVGLIWFVQVVHYPLFAGVGEGGYRWYQAEHARRTTWVVAAPMLVELATGVALAAWRRPAFVGAGAAWGGLALLLVVWGSTGLLQVPRHDELARGWDARAHRRLVGGNWVRTAGWTARGVLVAWLMWGALRGG